MKKIISIVAVIVIIVAGVIFVPKLVHKCDDCGKTFVGAGYEANVVSELMSDDEKILCKDCAKDNHAVEIALGKSLDDFKRPIF